jgi:Cdc6-like AAA superfamily ATPase
MHPANSPLAAGTNDQFARAASGERASPWRQSAPLREIFTPTRPKQNAKLFSGRADQLQRIISGIEDLHAHIMIHGERGSGKTSLANVVADKAAAAGYLVLRFVCSAEVSFDDILSSFLQRLSAWLVARGISTRHAKEPEQSDARTWGLQELLQIFDNFAPKHLILIIDEYDRVTSEATKARLADLMKNLSDAAAPVTLLIIGIAENVTELFGKHPSLQRALMAVPLPLMTRDEIDGIISAGEEKSGLRFGPSVRQSVIDLAQGLPYRAQLLCYFAARSAVWRHSDIVERRDLHYAVQRAIDEAHSDIKLTNDLSGASDGCEKSEQADIDATRVGVGPGAQDLADNQINAIDLAFRPSHSSRPFRDQPATREPTVTSRVATSLAGAHQSADDQVIASAHRRRKEIVLVLVGVVFAVGIGASMLSVRNLAAAMWGAASTITLHHLWPALASGYDRIAAPLSTAPQGVTHASDPAKSTTSEADGHARPYTGTEQLAAAIQQAQDALQTAPPVSPSITAGKDDAPVQSTLDMRTGGAGRSEVAPLSRSMQMPTVRGSAPPLVIGEPAEANARRSPPEDGAVSPEQASPSPAQSPPSSAQGAQLGPHGARMRQDFEQFLNERQQTSSSPQEREKLFEAFIRSKNSQANGLAGEDAPATSGSTRRIEIWQALDTTKLRELASADSTVVGTVAKGSTFRVIDRSKDGKWLKIETRDGLTGYYWAARGREMR